MEEQDFDILIKLIDEAYKNMRMGSFAIDAIITKIEDKELENLLRKQNKFYLDTTKKLEKLSNDYKHEPVDINIFLKGSSFASIKLKTMMNNETPKLASMLIEGTTMGITEMIKAQNEYHTDNDDIKKITNDIVSNEEQFVESLKKFL